MLFEQIRCGGCLSYLIGDDDTCAGMIVDPHLDQLDRYIALANERGMRIHYVTETHTHADHFSAARELGRQLNAKVVMHRLSAAPFADVRVDDGESIVCGKLRMRVMHTPGHTEDSTCLVFEDRVLTGDTLLIGGTGRTDLPTGDPDALHDSLFGKLLLLDDALKVYPAHDYKDRSSSTIGAEKRGNPRLQKTDRAEFVALMKGLDLKMPDHLSEALRTNRSGGKTVSQLLAEASRQIAFMSMEELRSRIDRGNTDVVLLDVREKDAFDAGHLPGAHHLPRGQLELDRKSVV
jgi:glyoxylase-like metal-dependent hydrolase (beta-lactamase superfamily II)